MNIIGFLFYFAAKICNSDNYSEVSSFDQNNVNDLNLTENLDDIPFNELNDGLLYPVTTEMAFDNWINFDEWLKNYGLEQGFAFTITHSEKDKNDGIPRWHIYACTKGRKYVARKEAHTKDSHNSAHNSGNCQFRINAYCQKNDNMVYITKVESQHNHKLVDNIAILVPSYRKFTPEMQDNVRLLTICGVRSVKSDTGSVYLSLMKQQNENLSFHVDAQFEGQDNRLV
ncbi:8742_t:CDS:2 [Diversispora eburnea]|uniref:8742_t:CDS:1 n=1 Tax=Diversispora eburnea TaxID=1213867 RepID=A0A9N9C2W5_9GLOM|nr:8742_t:CDS:2 [Diversispora eburnea]